MSAVPTAGDRDWRALLRHTPQQARSQATIRQAINAADRLLARAGSDAVTTTQVAVEAGLSVGTVYRYFPDKEMILDAVAARYLDNFESLMGRLVARALEETWDDLAVTLFDSYADLYRRDAGLRAMWFGGHLSQKLRQADRAHKRVVAEGIRRILIAQGVAKDDPGLATACHTAMLASDAIIQEAFRVSAQGEPGLLDEAKIMLRCYLVDITARFGPTTEGTRR